MSTTEPHHSLTIAIAGCSDEIHIQDATVHHRLGSPPILSATVHSATSLNAEELLAKRAKFKLLTSGKALVTLEGEISSVSLRHWDDGHTTGTVEVIGAPVAALVGAHARAYTDQPAPDIIAKVLGRHDGFDVARSLLKSTYPALPYCVQYFESDFDFALRLAKAHGIGVSVNADAYPAKVSLVDDARDFARHHNIPFRRRLAKPINLVEEVTDLTEVHRSTPGAYRQDSRYPDAPRKALRVTVKGLKPTAGESDSVDSRIAYGDTTQGRIYASARACSDAAAATVVQARTTSAELAAGQYFELTDHPYAAANRVYFVTESVLSISGGTGLTTSAPTSALVKHLTLQTNPNCAVHAFTSPPHPRVHGLLTARVVGDQVGTVACDEQGRIQVEFLWMGLSPAAGDSRKSNWVRIAEHWAGQTRGSFSIPRVGDEVLVGFECGDPDQPIIVGSLYNGDAQQPSSIREQSSAFVIRSRTTPGGGENSYNEIRMEDNGGEERLFLQAQKDMEENIKQDLNTKIGGKGSVTATSEYRIEVGAAKFLVKPERIRLELGAAHLEFDAAGQVVLNGQIIRIG